MSNASDMFGTDGKPIRHEQPVVLMSFHHGPILLLIDPKNKTRVECRACDLTKNVWVDEVFAPNGTITFRSVYMHSEADVDAHVAKHGLCMNEIVRENLRANIQW